MPKKVTFNSIVKVVLIPTINELIEADLDDKLWCNENEFKEFKEDFNKEVFEHLKNSAKKGIICSPEQAMKEIFASYNKNEDTLTLKDTIDDNTVSQVQINLEHLALQEVADNNEQTPLIKNNFFNRVVINPILKATMGYVSENKNTQASI